MGYNIVMRDYFFFVFFSLIMCEWTTSIQLLFANQSFSVLFQSSFMPSKQIITEKQKMIYANIEIMAHLLAYTPLSSWKSIKLMIKIYGFFPRLDYNMYTLII